MSLDDQLISFIPYVETEQYKTLAAVCNYARKYRVMALIAGEAGCGKTKAAKRYTETQQRMVFNGQLPVLYFQLAQSDKTDRSLANTLVSAITREPAKSMTAAIAMADAKRLIQRYRYDAIIIDEVGFLQESGLEAVRTLYDQTQIPIILITMPGLVHKLERYPQFYSRIGQILRFEGLTKPQLKLHILPRLGEPSLLRFDPEQQDADAIVDALFQAAGGTSEQRANFRNAVHILFQANDLLEIEREHHRLRQLRNPAQEHPSPSRLSTALISAATEYSKGSTASSTEPALPKKDPHKRLDVLDELNARADTAEEDPNAIAA